MPGENRSGWTLETLKEHFDKIRDERDARYSERSDSQKKAVEAALSAAEKAVDKAAKNSEKWRENANEWRAAMTDKDRLLLPRTEFDQRATSLDDKIASITRICVGAVLLGIAIITVVLLIIRK